MHSYAEFRQQRLAGTTTCSETVSSFLKAIEASSHNAFLTVCKDSALEQATAADARFEAGTARPLEGLVLAVKDNISTKGIRTTCASKFLENFEPVYNATIVDRLVDAGAIIIGKTNLDEFAMGSSTENSAYGVVDHPTHTGYVPGGSSGGSATAVAAGLCHVALGSDTGGSIRQPASLCGLVGYKPTYGRVSRYGLVAFASSLDQIGPMTVNVVDAALVTEIMMGYDDRDATSAEREDTTLDISSDLDISGKVVGVLPAEQLEGLEDSVRAAYDNHIQMLRNKGAVIEEHAMQHVEVGIPTYYIIATAEASSNLARFDGVRYGVRKEHEGEDIMVTSRSNGFGPEVKRRIMLGTYVLSSGYYDAYYNKALKVRHMMSDFYKELFSRVDMYFLPTTPDTAFKRGERTKDPVKMYLSDYYTVSSNIAGIPSISIPAGTDEAGLPIGLQLQTGMFEDAKLLQWAKAMGA